MYHDLINQIKPQRKNYSRQPVLVCRYDGEMAKRIGDKEVYISEYVLAKILGYLPHLNSLNSHPEITKTFLLGLPEYLRQPRRILMRVERPSERYLIYGIPDHRIVLGIKRNGFVTEINTIHLVRKKNLDKLEARCVSL